VTDADRIEYLTNQLRYYRDLSGQLRHQLLATKNQPETHSGRGLHKDKTGDTAARNVDKQRKNRNRTNGL
jgi:hypothetical protein